MRLSYDYTLFYMPLLIIALWDRSNDAGGGQVVLVLSLLWWLPFGPLGYDWALARVVLKLFAFYTITLVLIRRLNSPTVLGPSEAAQVGKVQYGAELNRSRGEKQESIGWQKQQIG